jgi:hypothetical protein
LSFLTSCSSSQNDDDDEEDEEDEEDDEEEDQDNEEAEDADTDTAFAALVLRSWYLRSESLSFCASSSWRFKRFKKSSFDNCTRDNCDMKSERCWARSEEKARKMSCSRV